MPLVISSVGRRVFEDDVFNVFEDDGGRLFSSRYLSSRALATLAEKPRFGGTPIGPEERPGPKSEFSNDLERF